MLDKIILFSIRNKLTIALLAVALVIWGGYSLAKLPIDAVPDITNNQVQVITVSPSLAAQEVEQLISFPVEQTMATIPKTSEIRSISRFGLSVVTIVFHDGVDVFWARQQVNERLAEARNQIPLGIGSPEIAPITTGLGEIYQYIVRPKEGYEEQYSASDLRTIQDWIIRRQLLGTPGVADVSSFGGFLKQYEVALDPDKLRSYNLGINDIFKALEKNNQNTGGAYIDKNPKAWFIRSEGLIHSLEDIGKIVVTNTSDGVPIFIRNVADVRYGAANRYGAMTYNGEAEVVGAIVLMLKGENSNAVVAAVKARMAQIEKTLPEGVMTEAFIDRSALVGRAIGTVEKNLIEGALIVIAVLVLFLGNLRAGLIVASVIPLAMLFAVSLMHLFGVSGNLMSLGAIDFGLIVDGAVIIVEATMHHLGVRGITTRLTQSEMDQEVYESASKIRSSAAFGEIIILIVYLPILALVGIEGKMFRPMAQTVSFAILGAFILSLTYVPMMSAVFLSKNPKHKQNFSDKMMDFFHRMYRPVIEGALRRKLIVVSSAVVLFLASLLVFLGMGGEFIPTLEEGDFAVETRVLTGSSLSHTVNVSLKAGEILLREFPDEVKEVVGKVGSSEIPTDPMPIEACDLMILLNNKSDWKKVDNREDLADKMGEALEAIPGVTFGFQQPIQMRFNELISGVRQDVAVKIFGEDLNVLTDLSAQVGKIVSGIDGAKDLYVEELTGLPQIVVNINRDEIARFGIDIETVNQAISTAFAGQSAGLVYEGEKRFDLVVRLSVDNRQQIEDVQNLFITAPNGNQVPLDQVADVEFKLGPNQIQREDAKRRIIVGFNVRGRDVASIVKELQDKIDAQVDFPPGYYPIYGGQFENLQEAQARLSIAVPAALFLIFALLFFTFRSVKQSLLIFMAIPMAAIGGIFALELRGMPFSISAGIGFIALFGVAVLNGIVLIAEFNTLRKNGLENLYEVVKTGTEIRLRPVLMTAAVASLGFMPMALATSAGAEVQKPLATVVIGGLVSSTLLTLVVLPCLYIYFERFSLRKVPAAAVVALLIAVGLASAQPTFAQEKVMTLPQAIQLAKDNNLSLKTATLEVRSQQQLGKTSFELPKTNVSWLHGQYNSFSKNDNNITVTQSIPLTAFGSQRSLNRALLQASELKKAVTEVELVFQIKQVVYNLSYLKSSKQLLLQQDSVYETFLKAARSRYQTGESNLLEQTTAETQRNEIKNLLARNSADQQMLRSQLGALLNVQFPPDVSVGDKEELLLDFAYDSMLTLGTPALNYARQSLDIASSLKKVETAKAAPELLVGYFNQTLIGVQDTETGSGRFATASDRFSGFQLGIAIPLWFVPQQGKIRSAEYNRQAALSNYMYFKRSLANQFDQAWQDFEKNKNSLDYYKGSALPNAELILRQSLAAFQKGEIGYTQYLLGVQRAISVKEGYLMTLRDYNQSVIQLEYLTGNK